jgi:hypothetical protein
MLKSHKILSNYRVRADWLAANIVYAAVCFEFEWHGYIRKGVLRKKRFIISGEHFRIDEEICIYGSDRGRSI